MHRARDGDWDEDRDGGGRDDGRPRRTLAGRIGSGIKLILLLAPLALFLGSYLVDCRGPAGEAGFAGFLRAGACARTTILGTALSLPDALGALRHVID